jgi:multisubunit Na+/H+ antiporter MnhG subunit
LFGALGIIFSLVGLSQINRNPEFYEGRGLAIAGLVLSILSLLLAVIFVMVALATGHSHFNWSLNHS